MRDGDAGRDVGTAEETGAGTDAPEAGVPVVSERPGADGPPAMIPTATADPAVAAVLGDPVRLRPSVLPDGYRTVSAFERTSRITTDSQAVYGVDPALGASSTAVITASVSVGDQRGLFEFASELWSQLPIDTVDINGTAAISSTNLFQPALPMLAWVAEGGERVALLAQGVTVEEMLAAARGVEIDDDGPRIPEDALPTAFGLLASEGSREDVQRQMALRFAAETEEGNTRFMLLIAYESLSGDLLERVPEPYDEAPPGTERWDVALTSADPAGGAQATWQESDGVLVSVSSYGVDEAEVREMVNGLELVDEDEWARFLDNVYPHGHPTPSDSGYRTDFVPVPAIPGEPVWSWIERGRHLGQTRCDAYWLEPDSFHAYRIDLPPFQSGPGFTSMENLSDEERTFPCER